MVDVLASGARGMSFLSNSFLGARVYAAFPAGQPRAQTSASESALRPVTQRIACIFRQFALDPDGPDLVRELGRSDVADGAGQFFYDAAQRGQALHSPRRTAATTDLPV